VVLELGNGAGESGRAADVALGASMRAYTFDRYKTKRKDGDEGPSKGA
jgi:leucyl aminopeptidase